MMEPDADKQDFEQEPGSSDVDLEGQATTPVTGEVGQDEEDVLEVVFNKAERVCCDWGKGNQVLEEDTTSPSKAAPSPPETEGDRDSEREDPPDHSADEVSADVAAPKDMKRDPSLVKETVEIKAHFEDDEDGVTITTDNGQDTTAEKGWFGMFVTEDDTASVVQSRRRKLGMFVLAVVALVLIIGLAVGVSNKNKREDKAMASQSAAGTGSDGEGTTVQITIPPVSTQPPEGNGADVPVSADSPVNTTQSPEFNSTVAPTACDQISVNSTCYRVFQDEVIVEFSLCNPVSQDWVAVYPAGNAMNDFEFPQLEWRYTCGDQNCDEPIASDSFGLGQFTPPGTYQAYLFSNEGGDQGAPYVAIAASEVFEITDSCE